MGYMWVEIIFICMYFNNYILILLKSEDWVMLPSSNLPRRLFPLHAAEIFKKIFLFLAKNGDPFHIIAGNSARKLHAICLNFS